MARSQKFIAIPREAFYDQERVDAYPAFAGGDLPSLVFSYGQDERREEYIKQPDTIPHNQRIPKNYLIFPITTMSDEWEGVPLLDKLLEKLNGIPGRSMFSPTFTTMSFPQFRHDEDNDRITVTPLTAPQYNDLKKVAGDSIIEVNNVDELINKFRMHLPDRPPNVTLDDTLADMLLRVPEGPLNGVVVVAFDQQIAGSLASEELAQMGATVIKVEKPGEGDPKRHNSTRSSFNTFNAGKFSVVFSDSEEDQQLKADLLAHADVVIDNRSQAAQHRDTALQQEITRSERGKPLIYCSISGFGRGTAATAYDRTVQAGTGMAELNGKLIPFPVVDMATGKEAAKSILADLFSRERMTPYKLANTPCMRIDISMARVALNLMSNSIATYMDTGKMESSIVPFNLYKAEDRPIAVAVAKDDQFQRLCTVIDAPQLKQYKTNKMRQEHREEIESTLAEKIAQKPFSYWMLAMQGENIPVQPVVSLHDAINSYGRDMMHATTEGELFINRPSVSNQYPQTPRIGSAPEHGADNKPVRSFTNYLRKNIANPRAIRDAMDVANNDSRAAHLNNYRFVDLNELDFSKLSSDVSWARGPVFKVKKYGVVKAEPAQFGQVVEVVHDEGFKTKKVAMEGDWVITTNYGDKYLLPGKKFERDYVAVEGEEGAYRPSKNISTRKAVQLTESVRFNSPSGETSYIPAGGWIVEGSEGAYGIHPNNIKKNYIREHTGPATHDRWAAHRMGWGQER